MARRGLFHQAKAVTRARWMETTCMIAHNRVARKKNGRATSACFRKTSLRVLFQVP